MKTLRLLRQVVHLVRCDLISGDALFLFLSLSLSIDAPSPSLHRRFSIMEVVCCIVRISRLTF